MLDMLALPTVGILRVYEPFARSSILSFGQVYLSAGFLARLPIYQLLLRIPVVPQYAVLMLAEFTSFFLALPA